MSEAFARRISNLRVARNNLLSFHKLLIDRERMEMERASGFLTAGQFLNLLMNDEGFEWLRTISRLVVKIDEAFELNDGITAALVEKYESEIVSMFDETSSHQEFKRLVELRMHVLPEADKIRSEITRLFE